MRLNIQVSKSNRIIDYNYQHLLTGCVQKWLGRQNSEHGAVSLYSFSWIQNVQTSKEGIWVRDGSYFTLNFYDIDLAKTVVKNILKGPEMFYGCRVVDIRIQEAPQFSEKEYFYLSSPVLIKRKEDNGVKHYTYEDDVAGELLAETLKTKIQKANLTFGDFKVYFNKDFLTPKTKVISYNGIGNRVSFCPVIIEGSPDLIAFAWDVGLGNSTGIGFGALK